MQVSDQDLRQLVREAIAKHAGHQPPPSPHTPQISFGRFLTLAPTEDGQCIIEPAVRCNHCGYCQSYGH